MYYERLCLKYTYLIVFQMSHIELMSVNYLINDAIGICFNIVYLSRLVNLSSYLCFIVCIGIVFHLCVCETTR